jgi:hypothetical protein
VQLFAAQHVVEAAARLAGGHRQPVVALAQRSEHGQDTGEEAQVVLPRRVVAAVMGAEFRVALARHVRRRVRERFHQAHADHVSGGCVRRHGAANVRDRLLDAVHDDLRRVEEGAVPVEGDQVKPARSEGGHGQ